MNKMLRSFGLAIKHTKLSLTFSMLLCGSMLLLNSFRSHAQLAQGDLLFTGYDSTPVSGASGPSDRFSFVLLAPISSGTIIYFTDRGYFSSTGLYQVANTSTEGVIRWTSSSALGLGTEVLINLIPTSGSTTPEATVNGLVNGSITILSGRPQGGISLANTGDQIIAFQGGSGEPSAGTLIAGIHWNRCGITATPSTTTANWDAIGGSCNAGPNVSSMPPGLSSTVGAFYIGNINGNEGVYVPQAVFNKNTSFVATAAGIRAAVLNPDNWSKSNSATPDAAIMIPSAATFDAPTCTPPTITANPPNRSICNGSTTTFTTSATGATTFKWQVDINQSGTFTDLGNTGPYSGVTTATLTVTGATSILNGYRYRAVAVNGTASCTTNSNFGTLNVSNITTSGSQTNVACNGGSTGAAAVTPSGGIGSYTYSWSPTGATASALTGLSAGSYTVTVTDAIGCTAQRTFTITQPPVLNGSTVVTNIACNGGTTGAINLTPSGGTPPYSFAWAGGATTEDRVGLAAGTYSVVITDANSCTRTVNATITQPASAISATTVVTNVSCNGGTNGAINLTPTGGIGPYTFAWTGGATTEDRTGLSAGSYSVTITDANGCAGTVSGITVTQPSSLNGSVVVTNVACNGGTTGAINLTPSGGTPPYSFAWAGGATTEDRVGLAAGTYSVVITDANSCTRTVNTTITQPASAISATTVVTNVSCNGGTNGAINLTPTGGTGPYTFAWTGGATTEDRTGLSAGSYSVTITDANGCAGTVSGITVTQPTAIAVTPSSQTNVACFGGSTGAASINIPTGGAGGYTYNWTPGNPTGDGTRSVTGLGAGTYTVTVMDANACISTQSFVITQPSSAISGTTVVTNIACNGGSNGAINLTPTGGTAPYTFAWAGGPTTEDRTGLTAGTYSVTITDANGCTGTVNATVTQPASAISATTVVTNVSCNGGTNGAINLTPTGGTAPYTFAWAGGPTTEDRTGLAAGTYSVTITDANACTGTVSGITVTQPASQVSGTTVVTNVSCNGGSNGAINLTPTGGTPPYSFNWGGGVTTEDRTGRTAGTYTVIITDANGCTGTVNATITQPASAISATTVVTNVSCNGGSNGAINLTPTGGTAPYSFAWVGGPTSEDRTGLAAGTYSVTITDANACTGTVSGIIVTQPTSITVTPSSQTNVACFGGSTGAASINTPTGGAGGYTYNWTPGNPTGDGTTSVTGLSAGTWTVTVTDANSCISTQSFVITQPSSAISGTTVVTNIACFGGSNGAINLTPTGGTAPYTFAWAGGPTTEDRTGLTAGTYTVTITDANGCTGTVNATVTQPSSAISGTTVVTNIACFGGSNGAINLTPTGGTAPYTFAWAGGPTTEDRTGLTAGSYTVTITDANGCTGTVNATITQPSSAISATTVVTNVSCNGGSNGAINLTPTGGTAPYTFAWVGGPTSEDRTGLAAGTYSVTITDANACTGTVSGITVTQPTAITVTPNSQTNVSCFGGSNGAASINTPTGGAGGYTYNWTPGNPTGDGNTSVTGLSAGTWTVTVMDANACISTQTFVITQPTSSVSGTTVVTNIACNGGTTGSINLTPTGGTAPYTFAWAGGPTTEDRTGLAAGTYSVTITDANGCTGTVSGITVTQPTAITVTPSSQTNVACFGGSTGAASINIPTGGAGGYTYNWTPGNPTGDGTRSVTGLSAGTWTVTVTDANSCISTQTFIITQPTSVVSGTMVVTNIACFGGSNGAINLTPTGGTAPYTFAWAGGPTTEDRTGLTAGTYTVIITDANGCTGTVNATITQPSSAISGTTVVTNIACNGGSNGAINLTPTGGTAPYTFAWAGGPTTEDRTGLAAGTYSVTITDANGCTGTVSGITVTQPTAITVTPSSQTNVACFGGSTGAASINIPTGGAGGYTYNWTPGNPTGDGTRSVTGLSAGTWTVTVTDANSCVSTQTFIITQPTSVVSGTTVVTNIACFGGSNGAINLTPTGGTAPYTFAWAGGPTTEDRTGLAAGTYSVTITDANGCTGTISVSLTAPAALVATAGTVTNVNCNGAATGSASVNVSGGTPGYTYQWLPSGGTASSATGLVAGNYIVNITDANGCTTSQSFNITQPTAVVLASASLSQGIVASSYSKTFTATGGSGSFNYEISAGALPSGLVLSTTGVLSGTPTVSGTFGFTVKATESGCGQFVSTAYSLTINAGGQTINFGALPAKMFGDTPFNLTGTSTSGLTLNYASSNTAVATISGSTVTIVGAGTATITASQAGNANYNSATAVDQLLTVDKATATITLSGLSQGYDGTAKAVTAVTVPAGLSGVSVTYAGSSAAPSAAGTYAIVASLTNPNYTAAAATGSLVIGRQDQTIAFGALSNKTFGDAPFALTATGGGSANPITFASSNTAVATISGSTVTIVGAGTTTITASQAGNANYNSATAVDQILTVGKATATITLSGLSQGYDGTAKAVTAVTVPAGLSGVSVTYAGSSAAPSAAGTYAVVASLTNPNYTAAAATGSLVIGRQDQTIAFGALSNKTFGDAPFALTATGGGSANPITFASSNTAVATISGSTVTIVGAGTATITASQAGNANYNSATAVDQLLTVGKATATITLSGLSQGYDGTAKAVTAVTVPAGLSGVSVTYAGSSAAPSAAGTYAIVASLTNPNYTAAAATGSLVIGRQDQTIAFGALSNKIFGDAPFALTATGGGSANPITFASSNTAVATISGSTVTIVGAGTTTITASQAGNANYNSATAVDQLLTVGKATATITLSGLSQGYDGTAKAVTAVTVPAGLSGVSVTYAGSSAAPSAAGTYAIVASLTNPNYTAAAATGSLVIGRQDQTIAFGALSNKTFGDAPFALTATGGGSANPITFASSNTAVATISGSTVTIVGAGTTTITASQAGNANYNSATAVDQLLTVASQGQNITFAALSGRTYGDAPVTLNATGGASGNPITYVSSNTAVATISGNTLTIVGAGSTNITASQLGNTNYGAAIAVTQPLNVVQKPISGTFVVAAKNYDGNVTATITSRSLTGVLTADLANVTLSGGTATFASSTVGVAKSVSGAGMSLTGSRASNYSLTGVTNPTGDIIPKVLTLTADAKAKTYGDSDPALTYVVATGGLIGSDVVTGNLTRNPGNTAGNYPITIGTLTAGSNYNINYVGANLVINRKALIITADNKDKFVGTANPALTASYSGFITGETSSVLTSQPVLVTTAVTASPIGNYPITASGAASANYTISYVAGVLNVRPGTPSSISLAAIGLLENQPAGTLAGTFSSVSADPSATFTYTLVAGTGATDNGLFTISGNQLRTAGTLDYETKNSFSVLVRSTTQYGQFLDQVFSINLGDVNEMPTLAAIADQTICYTTAAQNISLTGISAGPETSQTTTIAVTSNNPALFQNLSVTKNGTTGVVNYSARTGASGTALVTVTVSDNGGTTNGGVDIVTRTFRVTINALPNLEIVSDKGASVSKGETIRLTASGGSTYVWSTAAGIVSGQNTAVLTVRPSVKTTYTVTATSTAGCSQTSSFTIDVASDFIKLNVTNIMSPNGDGFNDKWIVENIDLYPNNSVKIFDKSGRTIYEKKGYDNSWEGTLKGVALAEDTYYYIIDFGPGFRTLKGFITILNSK